MVIRLRDEEEKLYSDGEILIIYFTKEDRHSLTLGENSTVLERGVLRELASTPLQNLKSKIHVIEPSFDYLLEGRGLSYERVGLALAQARISELENELTQAYFEQERAAGHII